MSSHPEEGDNGLAADERSAHEIYSALCGPKFHMILTQISESARAADAKHDDHDRRAAHAISSLREIMVKHDTRVGGYWSNVEKATERQVQVVEHLDRTVGSLRVLIEQQAKNGRNGKNGGHYGLVKWLVLAVIGAALGTKALDLLVAAWTSGALR